MFSVLDHLKSTICLHSMQVQTTEPNLPDKFNLITQILRKHDNIVNVISRISIVAIFPFQVKSLKDKTFSYQGIFFQIGNDDDCSFSCKFL